MEIPWKPCLTSPAKVAVGGYTLRFPAYDSTSCNTDWLLIWQRIVRYIPHWVPFFRRSQVFSDFRKSTIFPKWLKSWWNARVKIQQTWYLNVLQRIASSRPSPMICASISIYFPNSFPPTKKWCFFQVRNLFFPEFLVHGVQNSQPPFCSGSFKKKKVSCSCKVGQLPVAKVRASFQPYLYGVK